MQKEPANMSMLLALSVCLKKEFYRSESVSSFISIAGEIRSYRIL